MRHDVAVAPFGRSARLDGRPGKVVRLAGAVAVVGLVSFYMAERRGPVVGLLAFVTYGLLRSGRRAVLSVQSRVGKTDGILPRC